MVTTRIILHLAKQLYNSMLQSSLCEAEK